MVLRFLALPIGASATVPFEGTVHAQPGSSTAQYSDDSTPTTISGANHLVESGASTPVLVTVWDTSVFFDNTNTALVPYTIQQSPAAGYCADTNVWVHVGANPKQCHAKCAGVAPSVGSCEAYLRQEYGPHDDILCLDGTDYAAQCQAECAGTPGCGAYQLYTYGQTSEAACMLLKQHAYCSLENYANSQVFYKQSIDAHLYTEFYSDDLSIEQTDPNAKCHWGNGLFVDGLDANNGIFQLSTPVQADYESGTNPYIHWDSTADGSKVFHLDETSCMYTVAAKTHTGTGRRLEGRPNTFCITDIDAGCAADLTIDQYTIVATSEMPAYNGQCATADHDLNNFLDDLAGGHNLYDITTWKQAVSPTTSAVNCIDYDYWSENGDFFCPHNNIDFSDTTYSTELCVNKCTSSADTGCSGYDAVMDGSDSNALCVTLDRCAEIAELNGYTSFEWYTSGDRCYINGAYCTAGWDGATDLTDRWEASSDYKLHILSTHGSCLNVGTCAGVVIGDCAASTLLQHICPNICQTCGQRCTLTVDGLIPGVTDFAQDWDANTWSYTEANSWSNGVYNIHWRTAVATPHFRLSDDNGILFRTAPPMTYETYAPGADWNLYTGTNAELVAATATWWNEQPTQKGRVDPMCYDLSPCPTHTTCAFNDARFENEVSKAFGACDPLALMSSCGATDLSNALAGNEWDSDNCEGCSATSQYQFPKGLVSNFLSYVFIELTGESSFWSSDSKVLRSDVDGGLWMVSEMDILGTIDMSNQVARSVVMTTASDPVSVSGSSLAGTTLAVDATYNPISHDILLVESFFVTGGTATAAAAADITTTIQFYWPHSTSPVVAVFDLAGGATTYATPICGADDWCSFTGAANGAYTVVTLKDTCAGVVCPQHGHCEAGDCVCDSGYTLVTHSGGVERCEATTGTTYGNDGTALVIVPTEDLVDGWDVAGVELFESSDCTGTNLLPNFEYSTGDMDSFASASSGVSFRSLCKTCSRTASDPRERGPYLVLTSATKYYIGCAKLAQTECAHCPTSIALFQGNLNSLASVDALAFASFGSNMYGRTGEIESPWEEVGIYHGNGDCTVDMSNTCGIANSQVFGEIYMNFDQTKLGDGGACECKNLCQFEHRANGGDDKGCIAWKYFQEGDYKRCHLLKSLHPEVRGSSSKTRRTTRLSDNDGWHGDIFQPGHDGWFSGYINDFATGASYNSATGTLSVTGMLPFHESSQRNLASRSRVKIVHSNDDSPTGTSCHPGPADEALGLSASVDFPYITAPKPATATRSTATWGGLELLARKDDTDYKVCYCAGICYEPFMWQLTRSTITVSGTDYSWDLGGSSGSLTVLNRLSSEDERQLFVSRTPFVDVTLAKANWGVAIVAKETYQASGCSGSSATGVTVGACAADPHAANPEQKCFQLGIDVTVSPGDYVVCLTKDSTVGSPSYSSVGPLTMHTYFLHIDQLESDVAGPAGPFSGQSLSASSIDGGAVSRTVAGQGLDTFTDKSFRIDPNTVSMTISDTSATSFTVDVDAAGQTAGVYDIYFCGQASCTTAEEVSVGTFTVTSKAYTGVEFVVKPDTASTIEVLGDGMNPVFDRIKIIDCHGTCGEAAPSSEVSPTGQLFPPLNAYVDPPSLDGASGSAATLPPFEWTLEADEYCGASNYRPNVAGAVEYLLSNLCPGCTGNGCTYCSAYNAFWDGKGSDAFGMSVDMAKNVCELDYMNCAGFDYNSATSRVFFNARSDTCLKQLNNDPNATYPSNDYDLYILTLVDNTARRLDTSGVTFINNERYDFGFSWGEMLRFNSVTFSSGGTYKVCFCDSSLDSSSVPCSGNAAYNVEIGTVHSSGLECLISQPQFQRGTCQNMYPYDGHPTGLRCYGASPPSITEHGGAGPRLLRAC